MKKFLAIIFFSVRLHNMYSQDEIVLRKNIINTTVSWGSNLIDIRTEYERVISKNSTLALSVEYYNRIEKYNFTDFFNNYIAVDQREKFVNTGFLFRRYYFSGKRYFPKGIYAALGPNVTFYKCYEKNKLSTDFFSMHILCGSGFQFLIRKRISLGLLLGYNIKLINYKKVYFIPENSFIDNFNQSYLMAAPSVGIAF